MKNFEKLIGLGMLLFAIGFNLWIYRSEPTALVDPNDNTFQYALVDRTNQIWDFAQQKCSGITLPFCSLAYLVDHWVPNWAEGYNLPSYYSHVPQIAIVASHRFLSVIGLKLSLFSYYHWVIYLLLCLFPISLFLALRIIGLSWITAGIGALAAPHLSTDGLYGLDPTSFLWRGYGLSSQLFAMVWLPLSIAYAKRGRLLPTLLTLAATTAGHLGIGVMAFLSVGVITISPSIQSILTQTWTKERFNIFIKDTRKLLIIFAGVGLLLGYWILPILKDGNYHNISVWDGIWKFDSFGFREVLKNLFNGDLFDFGRLPILTTLVGVGFFTGLLSVYWNSYIVDRKNASLPHIPYTIPYSPFSFLFLFWLLFYFGRTTWGGLFSLIPGMSEFHLSRFIVGVHMAGLFLIPIGMEHIGHWFWYIVDRKNTAPPHIPYTNPYIRSFVVFVALVVLVSLVYPQTLRYASHNDVLIRQANTNFAKDSSDVQLLLTTLHRKLSEKPGRIFAGRGGSWGKNFRIAETPMYMHLSTYGIPVILWLPETWSPNSDTEQYFSENSETHYRLYNVRYVVTPIDLSREQIQPFWKPVEAGKTWKLYEVDSKGYIEGGIRPAIVSSTKTDYRNVVRLWMHGDFLERALYPELTFDNAYPKNVGLPNFRMVDEANYIVPDGSSHNLFSENPRYVGGSTKGNLQIISQKDTGDMLFRASVEVPQGCTSCIVILKQSFHPSWRASVDGKAIKPFAVFPFYTAVSLETPGTHDIVFSYEPSGIKKLLLFVSLLTILSLMWVIQKAKTHR